MTNFKYYMLRFFLFIQKYSEYFRVKVSSFIEFPNNF